jgi:hypothetical protein
MKPFMNGAPKMWGARHKSKGKSFMARVNAGLSGWGLSSELCGVTPPKRSLDGAPG